MKKDVEEVSRLQHEHSQNNGSKAESWQGGKIDHDNFKAETATATSTSTSNTTKAMSLGALCICTFTQSWLMISVFPYSGFMAIYLIPHINEETAGPYAGLLASSFMIGRAITSYGWGQLADIYGRRFVLFSSLGLSALFSILFGMSPTFGCALLMRFFCGFSNGMQGIVKTAVSELAHGDERWETHGMSIVSGMWAWALLGGPALSGALAEPVKQYPHSLLVHAFRYLLEPFPFVLPNLVSVLLCGVAMLAVNEFVPETLPAHKCRSPSYIPSDCCSWLKNIFTVGKKTIGKKSELEPFLISNGTPSMYGSGATPNETNTKEEDCIKSAQLHHTESGLFLSTSLPRNSAALRETVPPPHSPDNTATIVHDNDNDNEIEDVATISSLWSQLDTRNYLIVYWVFSFYAVAVDEAFPLFCISQGAGLGLSEGTIGKALSGAGLIFALCQYFCYAAIVDRFGLQGSIQIGIIVSSIMVFLIPGSLWLNRGGGVVAGAEEKKDALTWGAFVYLSVVLAMYRTFTSVFFASTVVATNRTVIPSHRATMNGLSMMGGSVAKGLGPTFAGLLVSFSLSSGVFPPHVGAVLIFVVIGLTGLATAVITYCLLRANRKTTS